MRKRKYVTIALMVLFVISAGFLYSCKREEQQEIQVMLQEESSDNSRNNDLIKNSGEFEKNQLNLKETDNDEESTSVNSIKDVTMADKPSTTKIYIHICGEVKNPDVYKVKKDSRLIDVIKLAGGLTKNAAGDYVNQAAVVEDGQQVYIPTKDEVKNKTPVDYSVNNNENINQKQSIKTISEDTSSGKININTASKEELMTLSGIGEAKASSIIAYRQDNDGFKTIDEIKNIDGIKDAVYNKICDLIITD